MGNVLRQKRRRAKKPISALCSTGVHSALVGIFVSQNQPRCTKVLHGYRFDLLTLVLSRVHSEKRPVMISNCGDHGGEIAGSATRDRWYDIVGRDGNKFMQLKRLSAGVTNLASGKRPRPLQACWKNSTTRFALSKIQLYQTWLSHFRSL